MCVDTRLEDPRWQGCDLAGLAESAADAALRHLGLQPDLCEISLLGCDDAAIADLNRDHRGQAGPTNVLSWPAVDLAAEASGAVPSLPQPDFTGEIALGDIALAYDTCAREAAAAGKPMADHVTHLVVHGVLHLLGYDHIRDPDATLMQRLEVEILGRLGLDDPY
ncbi:rRNA maturation RNase YbeY [Sedimentitalea sp. HM32M-2]|uniref:rRNA maturation RNase YbeY n=1 Tax=Sedimentitalea sp. HM32M-2 TaxID=3351566 RepID=UPI00362BA298